MKKIIASLILMSVMMTRPVFADHEARHDDVTLGYGVDPCHRHVTKENPKELRKGTTHWFAGFWSGLNLANKVAGKTVLRYTDKRFYRVEETIIKECLRFPNKLFKDAVLVGLIEEQLRKR